ncbi:DUF2271 domain-containing protein [Bradyrhizobium sp. URHD0069]|uniref:DUF2271 domain-containing protein n=1 Tax=Bradyrhizobium sp. URHD0069 TaxID=1380355 RepID=UPI000496B0B3|nr:DUF2271 domain-containing protein [Bradyrhizobium sp. URHD0069]
MRLLISTALTTLVAGSAVAGETVIDIDIPRLTVVEYHKPYVAFWLENADGSKVVNLAVWYDTKLKDNEGTKWLKDMRQWWRRTGRELTMPADGLSSPTRPPGPHQLAFDSKSTPLKELLPGNYQLVIEAAREVGGRELLRVPFEWPPKAPVDLEVKGENEIGAVTLKLTP